MLEKLTAAAVKGLLDLPEGRSNPRGTPVCAGDKYGEWEVVDSEVKYTARPTTHRGRTGVKYLYFAYCQCRCGTREWVLIENMKRGLSKSCGCVPRAKTACTCKTHGKSGDPIYAVWNMVRQRILVPTYRLYKDYGGRGLDMDPRWVKFEEFYKDMGDPPFKGASLERLDNSRGYWPDNVVWAGRTTQNRNKRNNVRYEYMGHNLLLSEWSEVTGIKHSTLVSRVCQYGWDIQKALTERVKTRDGVYAPRRVEPNTGNEAMLNKEVVA